MLVALAKVVLATIVQPVAYEVQFRRMVVEALEMICCTGIKTQGRRTAITMQLVTVPPYNSHQIRRVVVFTLLKKEKKWLNNYYDNGNDG